VLISLRWLDELLSGDEDSALDAEVVSRALTSLGLEVDNVEGHPGIPGVVVVEVRSKGPHPRADRLSLVTVFDGEREHSVVCGAPNVPEPGGRVALATVGSTLPNGMVIEEREVRGEVSRGMLCSETELHVGPDGDGIIVLPEDAPLGVALHEVVDTIVDTIIEIGVTPNRPDALGHVGVARDLAAKLERTLRLPSMLSEDEIDALPEDTTLVRLDAPERCGRYLGFALEDLRVGPSPARLRTRLHRLGLRPISNVVDVTNLVLMEWGQPQHAFDRDRLAGDGVVVRRAASGEPMTTLDGTEIELRDVDLVIADHERPQALAGVMGGEHSMVDEGTARGLLEVAWFAPGPIRGSARHHGFHTDSSHRFERGVDHGVGLDRAARRALWLLAEHAGARPTARAEVRAPVGQGLPAPVSIPLRPERVGALLGMPVEADAAAAILEAIEITVDRSDASSWTCTAPTHRPDLAIEVDLIEEVMRFVGLEHLPARFVRTEQAPTPIPPSPVDAVARALEAQLASIGLHEAVSMVFSPASHCAAPFDQPGFTAVRVANPLRASEGALRTHLLPRMLDALHHNAAHHTREVRLFEIGRVYGVRLGDPPESAESAESGAEETGRVDAHLPREALHAGVLVADAQGTHTRVKTLVGALQGLAPTRTVAPEAVPQWAHPGVCASVQMCSNGAARCCDIGFIGEVHPDIVEAWDFARELRPTFALLRVADMPVDPRAARQYARIPRHPSSARDVSLDLDVAISASSVIEMLNDEARDTGEVRLAVGDDSRDAIELVEDYRGRGVDEGRRALLFRLHYRVEGRSPLDAEVDALHNAIVASAMQRLAVRDAAVRLR
jgi:phenylalanyl-tRNA synthetase beta chain